MLLSPVGWGLFLKAPFQSWAAAASWEEAGAPRCSEGLPGLPRGPGQDQGGYSWLVPKTCLQRGFQWMSIVGCRLPAQVTTLWMGSMGLFAPMSSLEGHLEGGWDRGSAGSAGASGVPGVWQVMAELNSRSPWLMKQGLEVRMEGLAGLRIVIQGHGTGGTLDYEGKPWKEMLHPPVSKAVSPAVVAQAGGFPQLRSQGGAPAASKHTKEQLQAIKRTNPATGVLGHSSWVVPARPSWRESESVRTYCTCLDTASVPLHQPLCKVSHLQLQPQPLLLQPCTGAQLPLRGSFSGHWLAHGAKGLFCLLWSLGWAAKQGLLEHNVCSLGSCCHAVPLPRTSPARRRAKLTWHEDGLGGCRAAHQDGIGL